MDINALAALAFASVSSSAHPKVRAAARAALKDFADNGGSLEEVAGVVLSTYVTEAHLRVPLREADGDVVYSVVMGGGHYPTIADSRSWGMTADACRYATDAERLRIAQIIVGL